ncbi:HD-GYP domain-containing protein [Marinibactrum halimedae]|uniref:HD family phosphohydrolase n=1 Tax=Marinibactrum halimedae TaxID=1444977 RepID=A0AA37WLQ5_9GAMM|nr:HD-GYP domain-containing protein [Marinibactrum halimedae]MCD9458738.1 HD-GYP domain-containing protein [Marinibactrum halimedae]GLS25295.1 HD family phosphohydrolase [Marinibactrum halimedae]
MDQMTLKNIKRIPISALEVDMYLSDLNNEWIPDNNLSKKGVIKSEKIIEMIRSLGVTHVYIDITKGKNCAIGRTQDEIDRQSEKEISEVKLSAKQRPKPNVDLKTELAAASQLKSEATEMIHHIMTDVKLGRGVDVLPVKDMADGLLGSMMNNQNALLCMTRLRDKDRYLLEHSFNVSVLMGVLARSVGFEGKKLHNLVTGALLHDIGKVRIDDEVLHKPGSLEPEEWEEMKRHVIYGEEVLRQIPGLAPEIIDICAQHHERLDGSGYPRGLIGEHIPLHSRMASVVDVYDAITADRVYHKGMLPPHALKKMVEWAGDEHLDKAVVYQLIRSLSVYPVGSFVELDNAKLAYVEQVDIEFQDKPRIIVVYDTNLGKIIPPVRINLAAPTNTRKIRRAIAPECFNISLEQFL